MVNSLILLNVAVMDIRDFPTSETSEHEVSSPTPAANPLPPPSLGYARIAQKHGITL